MIRKPNKIVEKIKNINLLKYAPERLNANVPNNPPRPKNNNNLLYVLESP